MSRVRGVTPKVPKVLKVLGDISGAGPRPFAWRRAGRVERDGCLYFEVSRTGPGILVSRLRAPTNGEH